MTTTTARPAGEAAEIARLKNELADLDRSFVRRGESLEYLQLIAKTLGSLLLYEKPAIADTVLSLTGTFLETENGVVVSEIDQGGQLGVMALRGGEDPLPLIAPDAAAFWSSLMAEQITKFVDAEELRRSWSAVPEFLAPGFAVSCIGVQDRVVGCVAVAGRVSGLAFRHEELEFLSGASSITAMAYRNADSYVELQRLTQEIERQAAEAQRQSEQVIQRQQMAIRELSTPILELWDDVLALPIIGVVDSKRSADIMERLLTEIVAKQARYVIIDITGVEIVDTRTADHFIKVTKAASLLGTRCYLTGIRPAVAQTLVELGVDLAAVGTLRNLQAGLRECLRDKGMTAGKSLRHAPKPGGDQS